MMELHLHWKGSFDVLAMACEPPPEAFPGTANACYSSSSEGHWFANKDGKTKEFLDMKVLGSSSTTRALWREALSNTQYAQNCTVV